MEPVYLLSHSGKTGLPQPSYYPEDKDVLTLNRKIHMNEDFTSSETMADHAIRVAIKNGHFTAAQAKEYQYHGCRRRDERTTYYFSHADTGQSLSVSS